MENRTTAGNSPVDENAKPSLSKHLRYTGRGTGNPVPNLRDSPRKAKYFLSDR